LHRDEQGYRSTKDPTVEAHTMGIGISVFLLAVGAILTFAVEVTTEGVNLNTVGVILMIVGALGMLMSLLFWSSFAPFAGSRETVREERY
jgi:predicted membrane channel-forming protein YqfA (hemolysin III family)